METSRKAAVAAVAVKGYVVSVRVEYLLRPKGGGHTSWFVTCRLLWERMMLKVADGGKFMLKPHLRDFRALF